MLFALVGMTLVLGMQILAEEGFVPSQEALAQATQQAIKLQNEANKLIKETLDTKKGCASQLIEGRKEESKNKGCLRRQIPPIPQHDVQTQILVFVSFSMSEASLKSLAQEAQRDASQGVSTQKHQATLVMRGLYQDSFVKTAQKLQELGITVDIHPDLFETHHVTSVPTFVFIKDGHPLCNLKGNVTLDFVAKKFEDQIAKEAS